MNSITAHLQKCFSFSGADMLAVSGKCSLLTHPQPLAPPGCFPPPWIQLLSGPHRCGLIRDSSSSGWIISRSKLSSTFIQVVAYVGRSFLLETNISSRGLDHVLCIPSSLVNVVFTFVVNLTAASTVCRSLLFVLLCVSPEAARTETQRGVLRDHCVSLQ